MQRRDFSKFPTATTAILSRNKPVGASKVPLGVAIHALRGMKVKAKQLVDYAIEHKLDSVLLGDYNNQFENLEDKHLVEVSKLAKANDISIYVGAFSISETSSSYRGGYENAEARLKEGIRVATSVGSPIVATRIGGIRERYLNGGIDPHIKEVIRVMKAMRGPALDAGIKFAMENHGELRTEELLRIINETGTDICGALFDPNNTVGVMDDPMRGLKMLGKHILCTSVRDFVVYETEEGATSQSTAIGQGLMDYKFYTNFLAEHCPGVPIHVETVGSAKRSIPFLKPEFWDGFPDVHSSEIVDFLQRIRHGQPVEIAEPPAGADKNKFDIEQQQFMLQQSLDYLRRECGAGLKSYSIA
ncbi:sugar phosphate isomerase/epimerase family protein [Bacteroidota bacterium]